MAPPALCKQDAESCQGKFGCFDQIYVADADGASPIRVSPPYRDDSGPGCSTAPISWSPDGTRLLFTHISNDAPSNVAILTLKTGAVQRLRLPGLEHGAAWGKPGIAYVDSAGRIRVVEPSPGGLLFTIEPHAELGTLALAWSNRGDLATIQGKRIVIYSGTGRRLADFSGATRTQAPALGSNLVWSPDGHRLLVCLDPFGGLSAEAHQKLVDTRQKRDRYPALVPYLVNADGTHWRRFQLPNPEKKESLCSATSWR